MTKFQHDADNSPDLFIGKEALYPEFDARSPERSITLGGNNNHLVGVNERPSEFLDGVCKTIEYVLRGVATGGSASPGVIVIKVWLSSVSSRLDPPRPGDVTLLPRTVKKVQDDLGLSDVAFRVEWFESDVDETNEMGRFLEREFPRLVTFVTLDDPDRVWP